MYNLNEYAFLLGDPRRTCAYAEAIAALVRPGSVVADIGAGGGLLSVLAAKAGARRVYAIEAVPLGSVVTNSAARSGVGDVVTFVGGMSTEVTLPEPVDVIVSDIRGVLPFFRAHLPSIMDARQRFLREGGLLIPYCDTLHAALVCAPQLYQRHVGVFEAAPYGVDMNALREMAANRWYRGITEELTMASHAIQIATLEYMRLSDPNLDASFELISTIDARVHGICVWFDSDLAPGVHLSNSPDREETIYGRAFFPLDHPLSVQCGEPFGVRLRASLLGRDYTWTWDIDSVSRQPPVRFRHSTFKGIAIG